MKSRVFLFSAIFSSFSINIPERESYTFPPFVSSLLWLNVERVSLLWWSSSVSSFATRWQRLYLSSWKQEEANSRLRGELGSVNTISKESAWEEGLAFRSIRDIYIRIVTSWCFLAIIPTTRLSQDFYFGGKQAKGVAMRSIYAFPPTPSFRIYEGENGEIITKYLSSYVEEYVPPLFSTPTVF